VFPGINAVGHECNEAASFCLETLSYNGLPVVNLTVPFSFMEDLIMTCHNWNHFLFGLCILSRV
jgi:hypothetical protein